MNKIIDISNIVLETPRIIIRPWKESDLQDFFNYASNPDVGPNAGWPRHESIEITKIILSSFIEDKKVFCLEDKLTHTAIGSLGIEQYNENDFPELNDLIGREIGYVLSKDYWKKGIMTECVKEVIKYLFEVEKLDFITCGAFIQNARSRSVQEKCGFEYVKTVEYPTRMNTIETCNMTIIYRNDYILHQNVLKNDESLTNLTCSKFIKDNYIRYYDNNIKDMWDHNYFEIINNFNIDDNLINELKKIKEERQETHLKLICNHELNIKTKDDFESGMILTMLKKDLLETLKINDNLEFKNVVEDNIEKDIENLDLKYYAERFGESFIKNKSKVLYPLCKKNKDFNFYGAYIDGKIVCMASCYVHDGVIAVDDLLVEEEYRHQTIATSMLNYLFKRFNLPMYLHADFDDTPKQMYEKLGFKVIDKTYEYLLLDK